MGQPSATTVNWQTGEVLLAYTEGEPAGTLGVQRHLKLGNLDAPVVGARVPLSNAGLTRTDGKPDALHNFDITYSPSRKRFFMIREVWPNPTDAPNYISSHVEIDSIDEASFWSGTGTWRREARISPTHTGFPRNHNPGIQRTTCGKSNKGPLDQSLYTYNLWQITLTL